MTFNIKLIPMKIRQIERRFHYLSRSKSTVYESEDNTIYFKDGYYYSSELDYKISSKELFNKTSSHVYIYEVKFKHYVLFYFVCGTSCLVLPNMEKLSYSNGSKLNLLKMYLIKLLG